MSYLLIQILICLLIVGLIGLVIGWFLKGEFKKKLLENDNKWNTQLAEVNASWEGKVENLLDDAKSNKEDENLKMFIIQDELNLVKTDAKDSLLNWRTKLAESNSFWENKLQGVISEKKMSINSIEEKLSSVKSVLLLSANRVKELESQLSAANHSVEEAQNENQILKSRWNTKFRQSNNMWEEKTKDLMREKAIAREELSEYENKFLNLEMDRTALRSQLENTDTTIEQMDEKFKKVDSNWNEKIQILEAKKDNELNMIIQEFSTNYEGKVKTLNDELLDVKAELLIAKTSQKEVNSSRRKSKKISNKGKRNYSKLKEWKEK